MEKFTNKMVIKKSQRFFTTNPQILNGRRELTGRTMILLARTKVISMTLITTEVGVAVSKTRIQIMKTRLHLLIIFRNI